MSGALRILDARSTCILHRDLVVLLGNVNAVAGLNGLFLDTHGDSSAVDDDVVRRGKIVL